MAEILATLDGDADSLETLSVLTLKAAAKGEGRSADAARAALDKYTVELRGGASRADAAVKARASLKASMTGGE